MARDYINCNQRTLAVLNRDHRVFNQSVWHHMVVALKTFWGKRWGLELSTDPAAEHRPACIQLFQLLEYLTTSLDWDNYHDIIIIRAFLHPAPNPARTLHVSGSECFTWNITVIHTDRMKLNNSRKHAHIPSSSSRTLHVWGPKCFTWNITVIHTDRMKLNNSRKHAHIPSSSSRTLHVWGSECCTWHITTIHSLI